MGQEIKVNNDELAKLPISDLYAIFDSLDSWYVGVNFDKEKTIITEEIYKRVKLIFPDFNKYKETNDY